MLPRVSPGSAINSTRPGGQAAAGRFDRKGAGTLSASLASGSGSTGSGVAVTVKLAYPSGPAGWDRAAEVGLAAPAVARAEAADCRRARTARYRCAIRATHRASSRPRARQLADSTVSILSSFGLFLPYSPSMNPARCL